MKIITKLLTKVCGSGLSRVAGICDSSRLDSICDAWVERSVAATAAAILVL